MKRIFLQSGWTKFGVIGIIISAIIGALGSEILLKLIPSSAGLVAPWAIVSLFVIPLTFCVQLVMKLWELKEQDDVSRGEARRLRLIIDGKTRQFFIAIVYYIISAVIVVTFFVFFTNDQELFRVAIKTTGCLFGISMFSIYLIWLEMKEISDFKAKLQERTLAKKRQKSALKRLSDHEAS